MEVSKNAIRKVIAYECPFCKTLRRTRKIAENHMGACYKNPNGKSCKRCDHIKTSYKDGNRRVCSVTGKTCNIYSSKNCDSYTKYIRIDRTKQ